VIIPAAVLAHARAIAQSLGSLAGIDVDAEVLLGGRAALLGLRNQGRVSAGGATTTSTSTTSSDGSATDMPPAGRSRCTA
jgi:hypothetical protein